jgi:hypothetical protein
VASRGEEADSPTDEARIVDEGLNINRCGTIIGKFSFFSNEDLISVN